MLSELGNLSVLIASALSFILILFSMIELRNNEPSPTIRIKIFNFTIIFTNLSFYSYHGYLFSDFSLINVYENTYYQADNL